MTELFSAEKPSLKLTDYCIFSHPHEQPCLVEIDDVAIWLDANLKECAPDKVMEFFIWYMKEKLK